MKPMKPAKKRRPASRKPAPPPPGAIEHLRGVLLLLRGARFHARHAECPNLIAKIHSAIKSHGGAVRHMQRRCSYYKGGES